MRNISVLVLTSAFLTSPLLGDELSFVPDKTLQVIAEELSGEMALRNLEGISGQHRMRASKEYRRAAELVVDQLKRYGFDDARIDEFPVDGKLFYGTQRSRPAWNVDSAALWELKANGDRVKLADWASQPLTVAQDSASGEVDALLVDIGAGTSDADYAGKEIRGRFVLTSSQPESVVPLAIARHGAGGIVSYAQNQRTAWWGEDQNLIRWGHLDTFSKTPAFAFMISLAQARDFQRRLGSGEKIRLQGMVRSKTSPGTYDIPMATIRGKDRSSEEIVYSCHLDHPRPGANDNASGCVAILEVARTLNKLVAENRLPRPRRTIRFVWPPEIEGTLALLTARPDIRKAARAAVHLDMVGGGPATKAMFHITRGPASLPSFVYDIADAVGGLANRETANLAMTGSARFPLVANGGGKEALAARMVPFTLGSDHQIYTDSSFGIPAIYLNDWPDRYIHTNADTASNIDPTKLERAAFIAAVTGYTLANLSASDTDAVMSVIAPARLHRAATLLENARDLDKTERRNAADFAEGYETAVAASWQKFSGAAATPAAASPLSLHLLLGVEPGRPNSSGVVYERNPSIPGPTSAFGYDYLDDHYGAEAAAKLRLSTFSGARGSGADYTYEALNLVDGRRTTSEIADALSAIYGRVPREIVEEYLLALEKVGLLRRSID
jgi:aminopeptidase YwaD